MNKSKTLLIATLALLIPSKVTSCDREDPEVHTKFISCKALLDIYALGVDQALIFANTQIGNASYYHYLYRAYDKRNKKFETKITDFNKAATDFGAKYLNIKNTLNNIQQKANEYAANYNIIGTDQIENGIRNCYSILNGLPSSDIYEADKSSLNSKLESLANEFHTFEQELVTDVPFERCFNHMCSLLEKHEQGHDIDAILESIKIDPNLDTEGKIGALARYIGHIQDKIDKIKGIKIVMDQCHKEKQNQHLTTPQLARIPAVLNTLNQDLDRFSNLYDAANQLATMAESRSQNTKLALQ